VAAGALRDASGLSSRGWSPPAAGQEGGSVASVAFEHVGKTYPNGVAAVVDCSLEVADGELVVLVGPSGCGKSTLLRMLAGLETVGSGAIRIGDRVVNDLSPQERNVAMVFQDYALYPFMSVRRNLEFPLKMRRLGRAETARRVAWAAEVLELGPLLDRLPKHLSGGQRQRVAMGRALVREPTVSLLDEPLSNLDAKLRVEVRAEIAALQRRTRTTMIYVTHDQTEAMTLGHRIAVLDRGRLQQVAPPQELYDAPANAFVAGFIGNPPMNVFPVRAQAGDRGNLRITIADQAVEVAAAADLAARVRRVGLRPEAFALAAEHGAPSLQAAVEHVEFLGHETLAYVRLGAGSAGVRLAVRLDGMQPLSTGERVRLRFRNRALYLFDEQGHTLPRGG
jgi:ABC-type sugar transport system ATPase subunit